MGFGYPGELNVAHSPGVTSSIPQVPHGTSIFARTYKYRRKRAFVLMMNVLESLVILLKDVTTIYQFSRHSNGCKLFDQCKKTHRIHRIGLGVEDFLSFNTGRRIINASRLQRLSCAVSITLHLFSRRFFFHLFAHDAHDC